MSYIHSFNISVFSILKALHRISLIKNVAKNKYGGFLVYKFHFSMDHFRLGQILESEAFFLSGNINYLHVQYGSSWYNPPQILKHQISITMLRVKNKLAVKFSSNEEGILNSYGDMEYKFHNEDISLPEKEQRKFSSLFTFKDHWKENQVIHVSVSSKWVRKEKLIY